jgi:transcription elongation factor Elf1
MNITKNSTTITCPHCKNATTYEFGLHELVDGRKLVCGKCGREIVIDRNAFEKAEEILEHLPTSNLFNMTTVTNSSMSFQCPDCQKTTTTTDMTIARLVDGEMVYCIHCGTVIPVDAQKLKQAEGALRGLAIGPGGGKTESFNTPEGPVVVTRKTFNVDVKTNLDIGKTGGPGAGGSVGGTPILTPRRVIEPKKGCLGVLAMFALMGALILINAFMS